MHRYTTLLALATAATALAGTMASTAQAVTPTHTTAPAHATTAHAATAAVSVVPVGRHSSAAARLQQELRTLGYFHQTPTGYYGPITRAAVSAFQKAHHLPVTGLDDKTTNTAITRAITHPASTVLMGNITSATPAKGAEKFTLRTVHVCTAKDTTKTCQGQHLTASHPYSIIPTGTRTLTVTNPTPMSVLKPGTSNTFIRTTVGQGMKINPYGYYAFTLDKTGKVTAITQVYMQ